MPSSKEYAEYLMEQLSIATNDSVSFAPMMGEYVVYYKDKVIGGIYDDHFLVKPTESAKALLPDTEPCIPYEGAKAMLLVEEFDDRQLMNELLQSMYPEIPARKPRKKNASRTAGR